MLSVFFAYMMPTTFLKKQNDHMYHGNICWIWALLIAFVFHFVPWFLNKLNTSTQSDLRNINMLQLLFNKSALSSSEYKQVSCLMLDNIYPENETVIARALSDVTNFIDGLPLNRYVHIFLMLSSLCVHVCLSYVNFNYDVSNIQLWF